MAQAIPAALMVAGTALSAGGSIISSNAEAKSLRSQAAQLDAQAMTDRASSQRQSIEERRQSRLAQSRALALTGVSGAGSDDPSIVNLMADLEGEGEYRALTALYEGETSARSKEAQAAANRKSAKATKTAGILNAAGSILKSGTSLYDRYGGK